MVWTVYPSENDVAATPGDGLDGTELSHKPYAQMWVANHIVSGFTLPATDPDLNIPVAAGEAEIDGQRVVSDAVENIGPLTANNTNHIFLQLSVDSDALVDDVNVVFNTTGTPPVRSVKLGRLVTDATSVTARYDDRALSPIKDSSVQAKKLDLDVGESLDVTSRPIVAAGGVWTDVGGTTFTMDEEKAYGVVNNILLFMDLLFSLTALGPSTMQLQLLADGNPVTTIGGVTVFSIGAVQDYDAREVFEIPATGEPITVKLQVRSSAGALSITVDKTKLLHWNIGHN